MPERTCSVEDCQDEVRGREWCGKHYQRWKKHGDPSVVISRKSLTCTECGEPRGQGGHSGVCRECRNTLQNARRRELHPLPERACKVCGVDITARHVTARCCSRKCTYKRLNAKRSPEYQRNAQLRQIYGITLDDYNVMLDAQGGVCLICGNDGSRCRGGILDVDHCHRTKRVRGLLCDQCNTAIGKLRDDPVLLRRAADYLEAHASLI